jgi:ectoine hydroxylase-related dioxygenase (phytanoyl-CoA dioxygenase family)
MLRTVPGFAATGHGVDYRARHRLCYRAGVSFVSQAHIDAFRRDGFVVVPDLLDADELETFGAAVDAAVAARMRHDRRRLEEKTPYEQSFQQCLNLWEDCPDVRPLTFHPRVARAAAELLGVAALRVWHDQALYKEVGGRRTDAHQDQGYWPIEEADTLTAWIPFDGSTIDGGAMGYVPGSHRFGVRTFVNIFFGEPDDLIASPEARGVEPVFVEVPRGGVAFHHGLTFHLAMPNRTDRTRRVHTVIYFRDGCTRGSLFPHPAVDRAGIAVGEVIAGAVTPIAWPRDAGDLPPPPPRPDPPSPGWPR